uniref:Aspartate aminotransferase family protein n=1 Tax=candidate division WOR-3 bacterium TaxID=2052148 RepID=A0A7C2P8S6_UNCW3
MKGFELPLVRTKVPGPVSRDLMNRLKAVECQNITYLSDDFPVFIEKSYMMNVWDVDGNRFVDLTSFFGVSLIGHNHPLVRESINSADIVNGMGDVLPSLSKVELLEKINSLLGGGYKGILAQNGADSVESAIKTAWLYTGRQKVISFENAYHGLSIGTLPVTFNPKFKQPFSDTIPDWGISVPFPGLKQTPEEVLQLIERHLQCGNVAMILLEPIQARGGIRKFPAEFVKKLSQMAKDFNVLLAFDEIFTGFGRSGKLFAFEYFDVKPDIIILGKALSSSFPISAMMAREEVMDAWPVSEGEAIHTSTFLGHPLICKIAKNVLDHIEKNRLWIDAESKGNYFLKKLTALKEEFKDLIADVRGWGLLIGIEFRGISAFDISKALLKKGYITLPSGPRGEVLELTPPVVVTEEIIDNFVAVLREVLSK